MRKFIRLCIVLLALVSRDKKELGWSSGWLKGINYTKNSIVSSSMNNGDSGYIGNNQRI